MNKTRNAVITLNEFNYLLWMTDLHETKWQQFGIKAENPNFAIPTGGPKITEILKGTL